MRVSAQDQIKKFVQQHAVVVSTIDPDSTNFAEFETIGNAIGNANIVMLGEQDHGDAPTFLAKTRLIKYLHEKKGFNILAFESDFFGLNAGWDNLPKEKTKIDSFIRGNIFPIWTYCNTCSNLFYDYIPATFNTASPLNITGFDNQMFLNYTRKNLTARLDSVFKSLGLSIVQSANYNNIVLPTIDSIDLGYGYVDKLSPLFYERCGKFLEKIRQQAAEKLPANSFWSLIIDNLVQENIECQNQKTAMKISRNARDYQMAKNLEWLSAVKYPNEKIIVWAANGHVAKYPYHSKDADDKNITAMGNYFTRDGQRKNHTYIIGFTSSDGTAGRLGFQTFSIKRPASNGFERWIDNSFNYAFVDFSAFNKEFPAAAEEFYLKGLGHQSFFKYDWTKVFDGIFYIRNMYPCNR